MDCDIFVLGAGIIGVCTAIHLQQRGLRVCLIDRALPGSGTSFGNAGLIERSSVVPYAFPRQLGKVLRYATNTQPDVIYQVAALPRLAGWLLRYWQNSAPAPLQTATDAMLPLIERSVLEHDHLVALAGLEALISSNGWIEIFRDPVALADAVTQAKDLERLCVSHRFLDGNTLRAQQPGLTEHAVGGIHWTDPKTVRDPGALVRGYAGLLQKMGGQLVLGDALSLTQHQGHWQVITHEGTLSARQAVITLGADAGSVYEKLGYRIPMAIKRGYHLQFKGHDDLPLTYSLCDTAAGFVIAPMSGGIRLTTGVEFATAHAPMRNIQLRRAEKIARRIFPLGEQTAAQPWMGRRPCLPDMRPVIGPALMHPGLWFNFGHAHHGLTLGPVSGRLIAQLITGETPLANPAPYSAERFR